MGAVIFKTKLSSLNTDQYLRCDSSLLKFNITVGKSYRYLKDYVKIFETGKPISRQDYTEFGDSTEFIHLVVRNIKNGVLSLENPIYINEEKGESLSEFEIKEGDIVVAISANCGSSFYFEKIEPDIQLTLSHYLAKFRVNPEQLNPKLLVHYLNSSIIQKYFRATETGKSQKNLSKTYLRELPVFLPESIDVQNRVADRISVIENEILEIKKQRSDSLSIINETLGNILGFNWTEFETIKGQNKYFSNSIIFASNIDCRMGVRFHNEAGAYLQSFLEGITNKRVKDFISEPIVLGKSVSPKDYDADGDYYYIAMSSIRDWAFEPDNCKRVSNEYSSKNLDKTVQKGDILLARSGEGTIGKVALIEDDIDGVFADFTQRIRLKNFDPLFAYYYFRSEFFQYLVYTHKKGLGNNTNIFPSQIREFPIPDWNESQQVEIVKSIKDKLGKQREIDRKIEVKQDMINKIISNFLNN